MCHLKKIISYSLLMGVTLSPNFIQSNTDTTFEGVGTDITVAAGVLAINKAKELAREIPITHGFACNNKTGEVVTIIHNGTSYNVKPGLNVVVIKVGKASTFDDINVSLAQPDKYRFKGLMLENLGTQFTVPKNQYWTVYIVKK